MVSPLAQQRMIGIFPKITGFISLICSSLVAYSILRSEKKRARLYHRLVLAISLADLSNSIWFGLSSWPIPVESGLLYASGNQMTCTVQGFFIQCGISVSLLNSSLAVYYLLILKYEWKEKEIRAYQNLMYVAPFLWAVGTAIIGLPMKLYNNANLWCWIASYPSGCSGDTCIRGQQADICRWVFFYLPLWGTIVLVTYSQVSVLLHIKRILERMNVDVSSTNNENSSEESGEIDPKDSEKRKLTKEQRISENRRHTKEIATQCFLYSGSFYLTWFALTAVRIQQVTEVEVGFPIIAMAAFLTPSQGLPNLFIYIYPNYTQEREEHPEGNFWLWLRKSL